MALTVTSRPEKNTGTFDSRWNALNLPNQYTIESDLFPTNSVDSTKNVVSYSNNVGTLQVEVTGHGYSRLNWVVIAGCDTVEYNGVHQIRSVVDPNNFTVDLSYIDNPSTKGTTQTYYNNYKINVEIYSGIRDEHALNSVKPMAYIGTISETPDSTNAANFNIARFIKDQVNTNNDLSDTSLPNYVDNWTSFYIKYYESYDSANGNSVETYNSTAVSDDLSNCSTTEMITNGDFATDLTGWSQDSSYTLDGSVYAPDSTFSWSAGTALYTAGTKKISTVLYQTISTRANNEYTYDLDWTLGVSDIGHVYAVVSNDLTDWYTVDMYYITGSSGTISSSFVPDADYTYLGFLFFTRLDQNASFDNITVQALDCKTYFWGNHSTLPFQYQYGGNLREYVLNVARSGGKFLTKGAKLFENNYYDLSFILDSYSSQNQPPALESIAYMWLDASDLTEANGAAVSTWIDKTGNVTVTAPAAQEPTMVAVGINNRPSLDFDKASAQHFNTDIDVDQPFIIYSVVNFDLQAPSATNWLDTTDPERSTIFVSGSTDKIVAFSGTSLIGNVLTTATDYVIKTVHDGGNGKIYVDNVLQATGTIGANGLKSSDIGKATGGTYYDGRLAEIIILPADTDICILKQTEDYLGNKYGTYAVTNSVFAVKQEYTNGAISDESIVDITYKDEGVYRLRIDDIISDTCDRVDITIASSDDCQLSETKTIEIDRECSNQDIYLTWLNTLGAWENWKFTAEKNYGVDIYSSTEIIRDITANWDSDFINGETQRDLVQIEAGEKYTVYSQYMSEDELEIVRGIMTSIKVQAWVGDKKQTVIVKKESFNYKTDGDKLYKISFTIQFPNIQIQSQ